MSAQNTQLAIMDLGARPGTAAQEMFDAKIYTPTPWDVAHMCWWWHNPEDDHGFDLPPGWCLEHKSVFLGPPFAFDVLVPPFVCLVNGFPSLAGNKSAQHRLQIRTRDAFENLRIVGYIADISKSPKTLNTATQYQFTIVALLRYKQFEVFSNVILSCAPLF